jgi:hypothetical protein
MTVSRTLGRPNRRPLLLLSAVLWIVALAAPAHADETISVPIDQAKIISLPDRTATVIVGNPLIADISYVHQAHPILVDVVGKSFGATNLIAMDGSGVELLKVTLEVSLPKEDFVVVYRGADRHTYSCTPDCSRRLTLGDAPDYFQETLKQITDRNTQSAAAGSITGGH